MTAEQIAAGLTKAQREAILKAHPCTLNEACLKLRAILEQETPDAQ